ncbi:MAG: phage tail protein [Chlorobiaceae bacterium]|nr:phage tail protein [Chlorobiaceae bacterium]
MPAYYPPVGFHFKVEFIGVDGMDSDTEHRFQEVGGLSFEIEMEELREGGENRFSYKLPKRVKYPNLILKRGLLQGSAILDWIQSALNTWFTVVIYDFKPSDLMVTLLDEADQPVAIWNVIQAYPLKWSVSEFKANDNTTAVESIELAYQYFERKL